MFLPRLFALIFKETQGIRALSCIKCYVTAKLKRYETSIVNSELS